MTSELQNYSKSIIVNAQPSKAYAALTIEYDKWWTTTTSNSINDIGDMVTFTFGQTFWKMTVKNLIANEYVELQCIKAHHVHPDQSSDIESEWRGTKLIWEIQPYNSENDNNENASDTTSKKKSAAQNKTKITFTHQGLVPKLACYEICQQGWEFYFTKSLQRYLDTGAGLPYPLHNA